MGRTSTASLVAVCMGRYIAIKPAHLILLSSMRSTDRSRHFTLAPASASHLAGLAIPNGWWPKSYVFIRQTFKNNISVLNTPGTIDSDYRGEIKIILFNHGNEDFLINDKDRIAQMILTPVIKMNFEETDNLPETVRGEGGFGSTGKWI